MRFSVFKNNSKTSVKSNHVNTINKASKTNNKKPKVSIIKLFRFSTRSEIAVILFSAFLSAGSGCLPPLSILIYGSYISTISRNAKGNEDIFATALPIIQLMLLMGTAAIITTYISTCLWIRIGERQARRIRAIYLHSIIKQDMSWFDKAKDDSLLTRLAVDTQLIQDGISEKFGLCISFTFQFIAGFAVGFYRGNYAYLFFD